MQANFIPGNLLFITGGSGWLGRALLSSLAPLMPVRVLIQPGQNIDDLKREFGNLELFEGDLRNNDHCQRFLSGARDATLIHAAGIIHPAKVSDFYEVNVTGSKNLLSAAVRCKLKRLVAISSNSPCGVNAGPNQLFDETSPYDPYMNYGRSKMLMEMAVQEQGRSGSIETVIIRAPWFYGPHQPARQTMFFKMIRDGKFPLVASGANLRSMAYVDNLVSGITLAAGSKQASGQTY